MAKSQPTTGIAFCSARRGVRSDHHAAQQGDQFAAPHPQPLDPTLGKDYASTEPLPKGWTNGDFPPTAADFRTIQDGPQSTPSGPSAFRREPFLMPLYAPFLLRDISL